MVDLKKILLELYKNCARNMEKQDEKEDVPTSNLKRRQTENNKKKTLS
jgi:hypothetical protein